MHDIKWIRDNPDAFDRALKRRGLAAEAARLIAIDEGRRAAIQKAEAAQARRNAASKEIGAAKKSNEEETAQRLLAEVVRLKAEIPALEAEEKKHSEELDKALAQIPNLPLDDVPDGTDEHGNVEHHRCSMMRSNMPLQKTRNSFGREPSTLRHWLIEPSNVRRLRRISGSSPLPKSRSPISCANRFSTRPRYRCRSRPARPDSAPRPARPARIPAA